MNNALISAHENEKPSVSKNVDGGDSLFLRPANCARFRCLNAVARRRNLSEMWLKTGILYFRAESLDVRGLSKAEAIFRKDWNDHGR